MKYVYKNIIEYRPGEHEVRRNLDLIRYEGEDWRIMPEIKSSPEVNEKISNLLKEHNLSGTLAAVAPGSVWNTKRYPLEYYEIIIEYLKSKYKVILTGGDRDKDICIRLNAKYPEVVSFAGSLSLTESVELLRRVKILICNDSAPTHLGMGAGIPVLTLYCSTVSNFGFFPYNRVSTFMSFDDLPCKPCGIHGFDKCPIGTFACGYNLKPEEVIAKIQDMVSYEG
jgi:heptosyltransferase-2